MEGIGAEVSQKIRSAIKAKLMEIGVYVDEELPDYVMVMVANKRTKDQMDEELQLFLGKHTSLFTVWLHQVLQKLQEVTVANLGSKRKSSDDNSKKKKKAKPEGEKKQLKKKIKIEPEDDNDKQDIQKNKLLVKQKKSSIAEDDCGSVNSMQSTDEIQKRIDKTDCKTTVEQEKDSNNTAKANKPVKLLSIPENVLKSDKHRGGRRTSVSSHHTEDLDDEDCINIGTDGELLYTAEEMNAEESSKTQKDDKTTKGSKKDDKDFPQQKSLDRQTTRSRSLSRRRRSQSPNRRQRSSSQRHKSSSTSPQRNRARSRSPVHRHKTYSRSPSRKRRSSSKSPPTRRKPSRSPHRRRKSCSKSPERQKSKGKYDSQKQVDKTSQKETVKRLTSPQPSALLDEDKVLDARELLNRKKAAREFGNKTRSRSKSRERSRSPIRKRRGSEKDASQRPCDDKNTRRVLRDSEKQFSSRRDDDRDRRGAKERDCYSSKWREDKRSYNSSSDRIASRDDKRFESSKPPAKSEVEDRKRSGPLSRVVSRPTEPEEDVETPIPSVVKVTPRPRRPASQQPSSTLIMKAISEANKSLVNLPLRPDSTQRARKDSVFSRTRSQLERIPPEKIAVSISNPLALQVVNSEATEENGCLPSPRYDESARNKSPSRDDVKASSLETDNAAESGDDNNVEENQEDEEEEETEVQESREPTTAHDVQPTPELETCDDELDTQFVVTLNGYDPDGLYSQSEIDVGEDEDSDWLKENVEVEPLLISTPKDQSSIQSNSEGDIPHIVINNSQAVNHANLIEVKPKSTERCKYWPACRLGDKCIFYHPTKPCKLFPACKFGNACLFIHPQCKFNALCTRKDCVFAHTPAYTPQPAVASKTKVLYAASAVLPCKFYPNCTNINCQFAHPSRAACRFGLYCTKKDCSFDHGQVAPVDKLKWTRVSST